MKQSFYDFCLETGNGDLLAQWDPGNEVEPERVTAGSQRKVRWICERGHRWEAMVKARAAGSRCPVCTGRRLVPGVNDLASRFPALAAQWHPTKNGALLPEAVLPGSHRRVWWLCEKGHPWQALLGSRTTNDSGCPVCSGRQALAGYNDLATLFPALAAQWHPERNGALTPDQVTASSNRAVWWRCDLGHEWSAPPGRRVQSATGCPICAGRQVLAGFNDLASVAPAIAAQWDRDRNGDLSPGQVTAGSTKRVWWLCEAGHSWAAKVYARTGPQATGCPVCARLARKGPRNGSSKE